MSVSDTDSVAHLVDYLHTGKQEDLAKTVLAAVQRLRGSYALGVVSMDNTQEIVAARRGNPLVIGFGEGENMIASDITAIISRSRKFIILDDNEVAIVRPDEVIVMIEFGDKVEKEVQTVNWDMSAAEKGGYQHFMLKEIHEEPAALKKTFSAHVDAEKMAIRPGAFPISAEEANSLRTLTIVACGTAYHAGVVGKYVIEKLARLPVVVDVASEFRYRNPILGTGDCFLAISQSGETADTLAAMREAERLGAKVMALTNVVGSSIARTAGDCVMYTYAGPEIAVACTKA